MAEEPCRHRQNEATDHTQAFLWLITDPTYRLD